MTPTRRSSEEGGVPHAFLSDGVRGYRSADGAAFVRRESSGSGATWILCAVGEFDSESVSCLREALLDARQDGCDRILLDLSGVTFGDSSFLHELIRSHHGPGRLVLVGPMTDQIRRLFEITGTLRLFHIALGRGSADLA
ncbi:STAS domain-containing protein [Streptomyces sp. NPDC053431]|uniref:STAS domain-containing protein n=1 Tax=Streptomyces sp. NPDC053431 TaxID=3365703 RepID=UPI0037CD405A